ncbi:7956_t:CDS:2, partial [Funneliformis caledonium]
MTSENSEQNICYGFFGAEYAIFAKYSTLIFNEKAKVQYTIFRNDELYDRSDHAEEYKELLAQIDYALILNASGKLTNSIRYKYNQVSNFSKWINSSFDELDAHIKKQENRPKKFHSNNLDNLLKYYKKEILDSKYQQL